MLKLHITAKNIGIQFENCKWREDHAKKKSVALNLQQLNRN